MSWQAVKAAFAIDGVDPVARFVAVAIAYRSGVDGRAWPSIARIAADTGYSKRAVRYALGRLVDADQLRVIHKSGITSSYFLTAASGAAPTAASGAPTAARGAGDRGTSCTQNGKGTCKRTAATDTTPPGPVAANGAGARDNGWKSTAPDIWEELADGRVQRRR